MQVDINTTCLQAVYHNDYLNSIPIYLFLVNPTEHIYDETTEVVIEGGGSYLCQDNPAYKPVAAITL